MGFEPMNLVLTKDALYQLSYSSKPANNPPAGGNHPERVKGIEPT